MDVDKKKELEELRKQIDPVILSNMMKYLADDTGESSVHNANRQTDSVTLADRQRLQKSQAFQECVRRRK